MPTAYTAHYIYIPFIEIERLKYRNTRRAKIEKERRIDKQIVSCLIHKKISMDWTHIFFYKFTGNLHTTWNTHNIYLYILTNRKPSETESKMVEKSVQPIVIYCSAFDVPPEIFYD